MPTVKLIRAATLGDTERTRATLMRRFEREARETTVLGSIHTIDVYDFGVTEKGDFYYVMQLLDGLSIERLVEEFGPVNPARTVYLLRQVCHSLGEAHSRGLVHRDVKPANILLCRLGPDHLREGARLRSGQTHRHRADDDHGIDGRHGRWNTNLHGAGKRAGSS